jgi:hypothetical protein
MVPIGLQISKKAEETADKHMWYGVCSIFIES